ncbi:MAG: amino acid racemase [Spirochaetales bacterium]|nr:amino acid racemase [Spirochaetales bacterium]
MRKIGIVGGLGPESTIEYYRGIIEAFRPTYESLGYPEIAIESVDLRSFTEQAEAGQWDGIAAALIERFETLRRGGAEFGAIASNTPHRVFEQVQGGTKLPLLSIVTAVRDHSRKLGVSTLCLLGTRFTMESEFFQRSFQQAGIDLVVPNAREIDYIQEKLFAEVEFGMVEDETRKGFLAIVERLREEQHSEGVILGCTELPLLLKAEDIRGHYIDTTAIHIAAIVQACREVERING